jgi:hypothetical protein
MCSSTTKAIFTNKLKEESSIDLLTIKDENQSENNNLINKIAEKSYLKKLALVFMILVGIICFLLLILIKKNVQKIESKQPIETDLSSDYRMSNYFFENINQSVDPCKFN